MNIAILGYGVEGESVYNYYHAKYPDATFTAYDNKLEPKNELPDGVKFVGGVTDFKGITADLAFKTPPIAPWDVEVTGKVTSVTREFLKNCPAPVIGVTGTKGKGTTSSMITSILNAAGKKTWLVGNIGVSAFDVLPQISADDIVVYELSSFQLWDADVSPHIAVVLGIEPEHLDVHKDFNDYVQAKSNIAKHQHEDDEVIYKEGNEWSEEIAQMSPGEAVPYLLNKGAFVSEGYFYYQRHKLCPTSVLQIPGQHNIENACAAIAATWSWVQDPEVIARGLHDFKGLSYRIELVRELDGVSYYNDSYSTASAATNVALSALDRPTVLIAGGYDRGYGYEEMANVIKTHQNILKVLLIGETGSKIAEHLDKGIFELSGSLDDTTKRAHDLARAGSVVLLSPGFASFDMFTNFTERGRQFTEVVNAL
ncbi:MAG: UDP-N-acetylmuramoylalanine--D-glutamate ligase [Candidatus Saccharibacteria bacterium]|nr:UDP-N-acetylmuramoylalanine--D-glutamate ligase [Candidatus Saccharibacteria bacterium]